VCRDLARELPADSVVGEEDSAVLRRPENAEALASVAQYVGRQIEGATSDEVCAWIDHGNGTVGQRFWTLDPIDGTKGFLRGDQYAVALALIEGADLRVGVLACPYYPLDAAHSDGPRGLLFSAVRGEGAWVEPLANAAPGANGGTQLGVVQDESSAFFRLVESVESRHGHHSLQETVAQAIGIRHEPMRMDSQAKYGAVARGDAALYLRLPSPRTPDYRENIWDHAAGALIVEEAGGRVTDVRGQALDFASAPRMERNRGVVVSNSKIHSQVLKELSKWL
jgi:3'(2'), 5'-bisphosphate nucleotidase